MDSNASNGSTPTPSCQPALQWKLWIYTNYDCNLRCSYCVAKSSPNAPRRAIGLKNVQRLVDEAVALGFDEVFFTGGEPFILKEIYEMLAYSSARVKTSVLTNAMLFQNSRLEQLLAVAHGNDNLILQVSLDGGVAEHHDFYRGKGSWQKTVDSIRTLQQHGLRVRLSTTETPVNTGHLDLVCDLHRSLGIAESDHFIRPLARRGYSKEGLELDMSNLLPEVTVNLDGVFWHPLSTDADMQVNKSIFPLSTAVQRIQEQLDAIASTGRASLMTFT
jgi:MoaA/NifB/PqqE/SkfB family radical SAM enzyme